MAFFATVARAHHPPDLGPSVPGRREVDLRLPAPHAEIPSLAVHDEYMARAGAALPPAATDTHQEGEAGLVPAGLLGADQREALPGRLLDPVHRTAGECRGQAAVQVR